MTNRISNAAAIAALEAVASLGDGGNVKLYSGAAPTTVEDAATGDLVATLPLNANAFNAAQDGTDKAEALLNTTVAVTDTGAAGSVNAVGYYRIEDSGGTAFWQGDVTATGGGGSMELNSTTVAAGIVVNLQSFTLELPEENV